MRSKKDNERDFKWKIDPPPTLQQIGDFEFMKDKILVRLVNTKANAKYLDTHIHKEIFDMSIVFFFATNVTNTDHLITMNTTMISNALAEHWGKSFDDLYKLARKNMEIDDNWLLITGDENEIVNAIVEDTDDPVIACVPKEIVDTAKNWLIRMFNLLTNKCDAFGCSEILSNKALKAVSDEFEDSFYILPMTNHTCIVIKDEDYQTIMHNDVNRIAEIRNIGKNMLAHKDMEVVSECILKYSRDDGRITKFYP